MRKLFFSFAIAFLVFLLPAKSPTAGNVVPGGGIELRVSFRYDASEARLNEWKAAFEDASRLIYDATDGQFHIKKIKVCNNSFGGKQADIFINDGGGIANVGYSGLQSGQKITSSTVGINVSTVRINHFQDDIEGDATGVSVGTVPAHELAHYVFGILDEYNGPSGNAECVISPTNSPACLMEDYYNRPISEFCVSANHDKDDSNTPGNESNNTWQQGVNGEACWQTIARIWGVTAPSGLPNDPGGTPPAMEWEVLSESKAVLVIDRSGSMLGEKIAAAKAGASLAVDLLKTGDKLAVVSFSDNVTTNFPLTEITGPTVKAAAQSAINGLAASGATNIGGGLRQALNQIVSTQTQESCVQFIILLTDGQHNTGEDPTAVIPDLKAAGIPVFTIGLGADADTGLLNQIADETGGKFLSSPTSAELAQIYATLQSEAFGSTQVTQGGNQVASGQEVTLPVPIDTTASEATFIMSWPNSSANLEFRLVTPGGASITPTSLPPNVEYISRGTTRIYRVTGPQAGQWQMIVKGLTVVGNQTFDYQVLADSPSVLFEASAQKGSGKGGTPVIITAHADYFRPVTGIPITGFVKHPNGTQTPITLFDNGNRLQGDLFAGDGSYAAIFANFTTVGSYTFAFTADNLNGTGVQGIGDQPLQSQTVQQVVPFIRTTRFSVEVDEVIQTPTITCPADVSVGTTSNTAQVTYPAPAVTNGSAPVCSPLSGAAFPLGVTTVTCTTTGPSGITASCSFKVTVNKVRQPLISEPHICTDPGNVVSVTFSLTNNAATSQNVTATVSLPSQLTAVPGSCTANVGACTIPNAATVSYSATLAANQTATITYQAQIADGVAAGAQLCVSTTAVFSGGQPLTVQACTTVNCPSVGPGPPHSSRAPVGDQRPGSVLFYNIYTSSTDPMRQNTRINLTNTHPALPAYVHMFFVDGSTCAVADSIVCLTPNQTVSFLASDLDPNTSGYLVAVAVDGVTGCPVSFNYLIGDEYVKFASGHAANLGAEAFGAIAGGLPFCNANSTTAVLRFDGVSYSLAPQVLALDSLPDRASGNDTLLILNRFGGNLGTSAGTLMSIFGILYDDAENAFSFSFNSSACQLRSPLSNNFPRTVPRFETVIPAGRSGWMKLWGGADVALLGAMINFNPGAAASPSAFNQGHNLHKLRLNSGASFTIPIFPPSC